MENDNVQFDEGGNNVIYQVHKEVGYSSEIVILIMRIPFLETVKSAKRFIVCLCVLMLMLSAGLLFKFSGFFDLNMLFTPETMQEMMKSAPFQNIQ